AVLTGVLEGTADAVSNFAKLGVGWYSDRIGRRKPLVVFGYALTGTTQALFALASGFPLIFAAKLLGWFGRGVRSPLRAAIGAGDCSDKLLLVAALSLLASPNSAKFASLLYAWRNAVQALVAFPIGWLGDRAGSRRVLIAGYAVGAVTMAGFALTFVSATASW